MKVLGLYDSHNCGACLIEDGKIIAAVEEERLSRQKVDFGFPKLSIEKVFEMTNTDWKDLEAIAVAGERTPLFYLRWRLKAFKFERRINWRWHLQYRLWRIFYPLRQIRPLIAFEKFMSRKVVIHKLRHFTGFPENKIFLVDHHLAHAASGYRTSGFDKALVFAIDGSGDGYSTTLFIGNGGELSFVAGASERASLGKLYSNVTLGLNFEKLTGEGKVMGLAAYGNPEPFYEKIDEVIQIKDVDTLNLINSEDLLGNTYAKKIRRFLKDYKREDIAAAVQKKIETMISAIVGHFVAKTGIRNIVLTGGVAMNVKMNEKIRELDCVDKLFVFPNMTDGGLAAGAALEVCYKLALKKGIIYRPYKIDHVFLGPAYSNQEIKESIDSFGLKAEYHRDPEAQIAELVASGRIVARVKGAMEYGPRALGNRSVLALPTIPGLEDELESAL